MEKKEYDKTARTYPAVIVLGVIIIAITVIIYNNREIILQKLSIYDKFILKFSSSTIFLTIAKIIPLGLCATIIIKAFFCFIQLLIRDIGKIFPEAFINYFFCLPTTQLLLSNNDKYSDTYKNQIFIKIKASFNIDLKKTHNKTRKNKKYLKEINEAVALIREKTRDNYILLNYNKAYGFWRNLTGGVLFIIILVLILLFFDFLTINLYFLSFTQYLFFIIGLILIDLICFFLTLGNGFDYAKQLYSAFLEK